MKNRSGQNEYNSVEQLFGWLLFGWTEDPNDGGGGVGGGGSGGKWIVERKAGFWVVDGRIAEDRKAQSDQKRAKGTNRFGQRMPRVCRHNQNHQQRTSSTAFSKADGQR